MGQNSWIQSSTEDNFLGAWKVGLSHENQQQRSEQLGLFFIRALPIEIYWAILQTALRRSSMVFRLS